MPSLKTKLAFSMILSMMIGFSLAQTSVTNKTLTWHSGESIDLNNNQHINVDYRIVTNTNATIDLVRNETQTITFTIVSIDGHWADEDSNGSLVYNVQFGTATGTIRAERKNNGIRILIDFTDDNPNGMHREFFITSIEQL